MDEYNSGMDPEVKVYFRKIINSFSIGILWLVSIATSGLFFGLGVVHGKIKWYHLVFYAVALASLGGLVYYYFNVWRKKNGEQQANHTPSSQGNNG